MRTGLISILVPLYNEEEYIAALLERVLRAPLPAGFGREVIVVDDGSTDGSSEAAECFARRFPGVVRVIRHERNRGKGAAVRTALEHARGEFSLIQDADLEYDPNEYPKLLAPLVEGRADAVYGSRFLVAGERRVLYFWHALANRILTTFCNMAADLNLTDVETCYKAVRTSLLRSIPLRSNRFGIEPELTIKLAQRDARIYETPISYHGRTYEEGKKIGFRDAVAAFLVILRYWLVSDIYKEPGPEILEALSGAPRFNRWMAETVAPFVGQRVLEIGAGIGNLTRHLSRRRERYIATDIDEEHLARLRARFQHRSNLQIRRLDLTNPADFQDLADSVDTVVCLNVLEHVEDDRTALKNLYRALVPGGRAIVLVPHGPEIYGTLDASLGHCRRYGHDELRARMKEAGFHLERLIEFNRAGRPGWYLNGRLLRRSVISPLQLRVFDRLVWLWKRIDGYLPWPPTSLVAVGVKPATSDPGLSS
ncbi:MAG: glycosyltransferase [Bryobacterales bacterium]|nr:glycosyltransferase [Bryobacteraceae bacterium]MDW8355026.1 glycosyltransferase [Bryobacterales bacterium]